MYLDPFQRIKKCQSLVLPPLRSHFKEKAVSASLSFLLFSLCLLGSQQAPQKLEKSTCSFPAKYASYKSLFRIPGLLLKGLWMDGKVLAKHISVFLYLYVGTPSVWPSTSEWGAQQSKTPMQGHQKFSFEDYYMWSFNVIMEATIMTMIRPLLGFSTHALFNNKSNFYFELQRGQRPLKVHTEPGWHAHSRLYKVN